MHKEQAWAEENGKCSYISQTANSGGIRAREIHPGEPAAASRSADMRVRVCLSELAPLEDKTSGLGLVGDRHGPAYIDSPESDGDPHRCTNTPATCPYVSCEDLRMPNRRAPCRVSHLCPACALFRARTFVRRV